MTTTFDPTIESSQEDFDPESMLGTSQQTDVLSDLEKAIDRDSITIKYKSLPGSAEIFTLKHKVQIQDFRQSKKNASSYLKTKLVIDADSELVEKIKNCYQLSINRLDYNGTTVFTTKDYDFSVVRKTKIQLLTTGFYNYRVQFSF